MNHDEVALMGTTDVLELQTPEKLRFSVVETVRDDDFEDGPTVWRPLFLTREDAIQAIMEEVQGVLEENNDDNKRVEDHIDITRCNKTQTATVFVASYELAFFVNVHELT